MPSQAEKERSRRGRTTSAATTSRTSNRHTSSPSHTPESSALNTISGNAKSPVATGKHRSDTKSVRDGKPASVSSRGRSTATVANAPVDEKPASSSAKYLKLDLDLPRALNVDNIELDGIRIKWEKKFRGEDSTSGLLKAHMTRSQAEGEANGSQSNEIEMDFLNAININVTGNLFYTTTDLYFGKNHGSERFKVWIDSGSHVTWVCKSAFESRCRFVMDQMHKLIKTVSFRYLGMSEDIIGELYESTVSFTSEDSAIEKQIFAVVDEKTAPAIVYNWRRDGIMGIVGFRLSTSLPGYGEAGTVAYNLLHKKNPAIYEIGVDIKLLKPSGSGNWKSQGQLHFGGFHRSASRSNDIKWVSACGTQWGLGHIISMNLKMTFKEDIVSNTYPAVLDTGAAFTYLPRDMMADYTRSVVQGRGIFHYDVNHAIYYINKDDFKYLKDIVFNFEGADFTFPPRAQVLEPSLIKQWIKTFDENIDDRLYLSFIKFPPSTVYGENPLIILGTYWARRYYVVMKGDGKSDARQVGIAEVKEKTW